MAPVMEQVAQETAGKADVFEMDIATTDTYSKYGIFGIPTLIFFKGGKEAGRMVGVVKKEKIVETIDKICRT